MSDYYNGQTMTMTKLGHLPQKWSKKSHFAEQSELMVLTGISGILEHYQACSFLFINTMKSCFLLQ